MSIIENREYLDSMEAIRVDNMFGSFNVLSIITNIEALEKWLQDNYNLHFEEVLGGYKLFIETIFNVFLVSLANCESIGLKEDAVFYRAREINKKINKFHTNCEKARVIKNIYKLFNKVRRSKGSDNFKKNIKNFRNTINPTFEKILKEYTSSINPKNSKDISLRCVSYDMLLTHVHNFAPYPMGLMDDAFKDYPIELYFVGEYSKKFGRHFKEFLYVLQYAWKVLLGEYFKDTMLSTQAFLNMKLEEFNEYSDIIKNEIYELVKNEYDIMLGYSPLLIINKKVPKTVFKSLLKYLKEPQLSEEEKLDQLFLWYPVEFFNMMERFGLVYGLNLPLVILRGQLALLRPHRAKLYVIKFIHPERKTKEKDGVDLQYHNFSYAFLLGGPISDGDGWLVFYNCCGDIGGNSRALDMRMMEEILKYRSKIKLVEYTVSKDVLKNYIIKHSSFRSILETWGMLGNRYEDRTIAMRGLIIELLSLYILYSELGRDSIIKWNPVGTGYDIVVEDDEKVLMIECKVNINNLDDARFDYSIKNLLRELKKYPSKKLKKAEFWSWVPPLENKKKILQKNNIGWLVLSQYIKESPQFNNLKRTNIELIFDDLIKEYTIVDKLENILNGR